MNPQYGMGWMSIESGEEHTLSVKKPEISLINVSFKLSKDAISPSITVYALLIPPTFLPQVDSTVYQYIQFKFQSFMSKDISTATYLFKVSKEWLKTQGITKESIEFYRYDEDYSDWFLANSSIVNDDLEYVYFKSKYIGGNYFLVSQKISANSTTTTSTQNIVKNTTILPIKQAVTEVKPLIKPEPKKEIKKEETPNTTILANDMAIGNPNLSKKVQEVKAKEPVKQELKTPEMFKSKKEAQKSNYSYVFALFSFLFALALFLFLVNRSCRLSSVDRELYKFVKDCRKFGKSDVEIKQKLLKVGWSHDRVHRVLKKKHAKHKEIPIDSNEEKRLLKNKIKKTAAHQVEHARHIKEKVSNKLHQHKKGLLNLFRLI